MQTTSSIPAPGDAVALTRALVRIDSRNPSLAADGPGEEAAARYLADVLRAWGFRVEMRDAAPGRPNVVARIGTPGGRTLMFNGHLDVVGVEGMAHEPFAAESVEGKLYGRGSADMKGGIAAMCAAAWRAAQEELAGEIIVTAVIDEEWDSAGTRALLDSGVRADAAIVTEPTRLSIMPAHRGFVWMELEFRGRAAHGSRHDIGRDAIRHAGLVLAELDVLDREILPAREPHPLLGRPSIHGSTIEGGVGMSTYPEHCVLRVERRTIPGETAAATLAEVEAAIARAKRRAPEMEATARVTVSQGPSDVAAGAPVVQALAEALRRHGTAAHIEGMSAWTDAALLNAAGIPAICFGPGDIALAHAAEEYIPEWEIERATVVLSDLARAWCNDGHTAWRS